MALNRIRLPPERIPPHRPALDLRPAGLQPSGVQPPLSSGGARSLAPTVKTPPIFPASLARTPAHDGGLPMSANLREADPVKRAAREAGIRMAELDAAPLDPRFDFRHGPRCRTCQEFKRACRSEVLRLAPSSAPELSGAGASGAPAIPRMLAMRAA